MYAPSGPFTIPCTRKPRFEVTIAVTSVLVDAAFWRTAVERGRGYVVGGVGVVGTGSFDERAELRGW